MEETSKAIILYQKEINKVDHLRQLLSSAIQEQVLAKNRSLCANQFFLFSRKIINGPIILEGCCPLGALFLHYQNEEEALKFAASNIKLKNTNQTKFLSLMRFSDLLIFKDTELIDFITGYDESSQDSSFQPLNSFQSLGREFYFKFSIKT